MKFKSLLLPLSVLILLVFSLISTSKGTVVTFDDLSETGTGDFIANGYKGLNWVNFFCPNVILSTNILAHEFPGAPTNGLSGYYYGMVSVSNVIYSGFSGPGEIDAHGTNFNFLSAYLTGAWNSNVNIEVQGFNGTNLLYDTTVTASATNATLFTFDYQNINRLSFTASGGQPAFGVEGGSSYLVMDNFTFEFVPEPSPLLLAATGALLLWPLLKRKRVT